MRLLEKGDRVRLKGHANIGGESIIVEGMKATLLGQSTLDRIRVRLLRPKGQDYECDVFRSQCVWLKKKERRRIYVQKGSLDLLLHGARTVPAWSDNKAPGEYVEFREVRKKK